MIVDILITNGLIVTCDSNDTVIEHGAVAVCGSHIFEIFNNPWPDIVARKNIDAQGNLVMPGLVNAHTHAAMTIFRGMADDLALMEWLNDYIFPAEARYTTRESVQMGSTLAVVEMLKSGVTSFANMYYFEDETAKICEQMGIRCLLSEGIVNFKTPSHDNAESALAYTEELIQQYRGSSLVTIGAGPHAPYTCDDVFLIKARKLANKYDVPFLIHLAETTWEYNKYIETYNVSPVRYLADRGILDGKFLAAHCVYLSQEDVELAAAKNMGIANISQCNMKLVSGVSPVPALLKHGVMVGLGTDGVVSNNTLDIFYEMKVASMIHKLNNADPTVADAKTIVRMATIQGANIYGRRFDYRVSEKGKKADIILISLQEAHALPLYNVFSHIVYALKSTDVYTSIINGKIVMEDKCILTISEQDFKFSFRDFTREMVLEIKKSFGKRNLLDV